jgi:hypothetical protein
MIPDYYGRLVCLCLASFFLVQAAVGALVALLVPAASRRVQRMPARSAARLLFLLRLAPFAAASLVVAAMCVPSYLWFEPRGNAESVGIICALAAALGMLQWAMAARRVGGGVLANLAFGRRCGKAGCELRLPGRSAPLIIVDDASPLLALSGVLRPRLFLSREVFDSLAPEELQAALRHEDAHRDSRDNWKRLALLLAPPALFARPFAALERQWAKYSEWSADDAASAGDPARALYLASALVRVARLGTPPQPALAASLTACGCGLEARVDRLLRTVPAREGTCRANRLLRHAQLLLAGAFTAALILFPGALASVHQLLETLLR